MNIALIDDHMLLTEAIRNLLLREPGITEVRTYNSGAKFLEENRLPLPDVIVTDLMMPDINGMKLLDIFRDMYKGAVKVIILSSITDVQIIRQAVRNGASGFLSKAVPAEELIAAIYEVMEGKQYIGKNLKDSLLSSVFTEEQVVYHLSPREKDVLHKVCSGCTIKEIAYDLNLSVHTVQYYHRSVMNKLKVKRTSDLIVFAMQHGLYIPDVDKK
ncbi:response regulator transcription factor [Chitinophagaceae bacterium MMS25-I14]